MATKHRISIVHPIFNQDGYAIAAEGVEQPDSVDPTDIRSVGRWASQHVDTSGQGFDYRPGYSRFEDGKAYLFPRAYVTGTHCVIVEAI